MTSRALPKGHFSETKNSLAEQFEYVVLEKAALRRFRANPDANGDSGLLSCTFVHLVVRECRKFGDAKGYGLTATTSSAQVSPLKQKGLAEFGSGEKEI